MTKFLTVVLERSGTPESLRDVSSVNEKNKIAKFCKKINFGRIPKNNFAPVGRTFDPILFRIFFLRITEKLFFLSKFYNQAEIISRHFSPVFRFFTFREKNVIFSIVYVA